MNDNDAENPLPFQSLAAITAKILHSTEKQEKEGGSDAQPGHDDEQRAEADRAYIEQRLRDFAAFEQRARGTKR